MFAGMTSSVLLTRVTMLPFRALSRSSAFLALTSRIIAWFRPFASFFVLISIVCCENKFIRNQEVSSSLYEWLAGLK